MVTGGNGKRFSIRALEFRVISATIRLQQMKSVYKVYLVQPRQRLPPMPGHFLIMISRRRAVKASHRPKEELLILPLRFERAL